MMTFDELRALRDRTLEEHQGDSLADSYTRGAVQMAWYDLFGEDEPDDPTEASS